MTDTDSHLLVLWSLNDAHERAFGTRVRIRCFGITSRVGFSCSFLISTSSCWFSVKKSVHLLLADRGLELAPVVFKPHIQLCACLPFFTYRHVYFTYSHSYLHVITHTAMCLSPFFHIQVCVFHILTFILTCNYTYSYVMHAFAVVWC